MFYIDNLVTIHNKFLSFAGKFYETHKKAIVKVKSDFYYLDKGKNEVKHICKVDYENRHLLDSMQECGIYNLNTPFDYTQEEEENPYTHEILGFILSDLESKDYLQDEFFSFHLQALGFKEQEEVIESMQEQETINKENVVIESRFIQGKESTKSKDSIYTDREEQAQEAIKQSMQQETIKEVEFSMQAQEIQPNMQDISMKEAQRKQAMCIMESMQATYRKHAMQIQSLMHERITQSILYTMQTKHIRATQHIKAIYKQGLKTISLHGNIILHTSYTEVRTRKGRDPPACHPLSL